MYRDEFRELQKEFYWTLPRVAMAIVVALVVSFGAAMLLKPFAVVSRVTNPDNIIARYEFFHDANQRYQARVSQIKAFKTVSSADPTESARIRTELFAIQHSCRELVAKYNAAAIKSTQSLFMGREAPSSLNPAACE